MSNRRKLFQALFLLSQDTEFSGSVFSVMKSNYGMSREHQTQLELVASSLCHIHICNAQKPHRSEPFP